MTILRKVQFTESKGIQQGDRPCAHGENVAQDPADPGRGPLKGFDKRRMIMGLHFKDGGEPLADIHGSGILSRSLDHPLPFGGKALQMDPGTFIGTMLAPHDRKDSEFRQIGLTTQIA